MNQGADAINIILKERLKPLNYLVKDESSSHIGHSGNSGGKHYKVWIVCLDFEGKNLLDRHRLVYDCLGSMMHTEIHALSISALAPSELNENHFLKNY